MKKILLFTSAIMFSMLSYAQKANIDIPLEKDEEVLDFVDLQEHGFILKTGMNKNYTKDLNWQLSHYSPELKLLWKVPIETTQMNKGLGEEIIATPTGSIVYHLENKGYNSFMGTTHMQITQIANGKPKVYELDNESLKNLEGTRFIKACDEQYFYIICMEEGDEDTPTQIIYHRFAHADFSYSKIQGDLPLIVNDKFTTSWDYAGHNKDHIWLVSKMISDKTETYQCQLVALDWKGTIAKKVKLQTKIEGQHLRPSLNYYAQQHGVKLTTNSSSMDRSINNNHISGMTHVSYTLGMDAWAGVLVDEDNEIIYTYGLYGKKKYLGPAAKVDGYYICGYDLEGNLLWQNISDDTAPEAQDKLFRKRLLSHQRTSMARLTPNNTIQLQIGASVNIYTHEYSRDGKKLKEYSNEFKKGLNYGSFSLCFSPQNAANKYYYDNNSKKTSYYGYSSTNGCVLVEHKKNNHLSLLKW